MFKDKIYNNPSKFYTIDNIKDGFTIFMTKYNPFHLYQILNQLEIKIDNHNITSNILQICKPIPKHNTCHTILHKYITLVNSDKDVKTLNIDEYYKCWYLLSFIRSIGVDEDIIIRHISSYNKLITKNPYTKDDKDSIFLLCKMIPFDIIDKIYLRKPNNNLYDELRVKYGIKTYVLDNKGSFNKTNGYYCYKDELSKLLKDKLKIDINKITNFNCYKVWRHDIKNKEEGKMDVVCIHKSYAKYENRIMDFLNEMMAKPINNYDKYNMFLEQWKESSGFKLKIKQEDAFKMILSQPISILTGDPGTGKSAIVALAIKYLLDKMSHEGQLLNVSFTGTAAAVLKNSIYDKYRTQEKDIDQLTETELDTVLKQVKGTITKITNSTKTIDRFIYIPIPDKNIYYIIVDEFSMVSVKTFYRFLKHLDKIKKQFNKQNKVFNLKGILFCGDPNQLPSIDCGNLLIDFIKYTNKTYGKIPRIDLDEIVRCNNNHIPNICKYIKNGSYDDIINFKGTNFNFINNYNNLESHLDCLCVDNSKYDIALSHTYISDYGINGINKYVNKKKGNNTDGFMVGDKIICSKNGNYGPIIDDKLLRQYKINSYVTREEKMSFLKNIQKNIPTMSGDIDLHKLYKHLTNGKISDFEIDNVKPVEGKYPISFGICNGDIFFILCMNNKYVKLRSNNCEDDISIIYKEEMMQYYKPSNAISIHKSQGKTIKNTLILLPTAAQTLLSRNLLYTAVSRTSDNCTLICNNDVLKHCLDNEHIFMETYIFRDRRHLI